MLGGGTLNYFAVPWAVVNNPLPLAAVTLIEVRAVLPVSCLLTGPAGLRRHAYHSHCLYMQQQQEQMMAAPGATGWR